MNTGYYLGQSSYPGWNKSIIVSLPGMQRGVHSGSLSADINGRSSHLTVLVLINPLHFPLVFQALNARFFTGIKNTRKLQKLIRTVVTLS